MVSPFGLNHNVVNIGLNGLPNEVPKTLEHTTLVCSPSVFQTKWHGDIAKRFKGGDERCRELVRLFHRNLMVHRVRIKEAEGFASRGRVDYLVYAWQRKQILWACLVKDQYSQHTSSISHSSFIQELDWLTTLGGILP